MSAKEIGAALTYAANLEGTRIAKNMLSHKAPGQNDAETLNFNEEDRQRQKKAGAKQ